MRIRRSKGEVLEKEKEKTEKMRKELFLILKDMGYGPGDEVRVFLNSSFVTILAPRRYVFL